jgi:hypothetical protein
MRKTLLSILGVFALIVFTCAAISSCRHRDDYAYQQPAVVQQAPVVAAAPAVAPAYVAPAPVTVVAAPPAHDGFLTGMLMGHLMSGGGAQHHYYHPPAPAYHPAPVVRNTTIVQRNTTIVRPAVAAPRAGAYVYRPSRPSSFGSFRRR